MNSKRKVLHRVEAVSLNLLLPLSLRPPSESEPDLDQLD